MKRKSSSLKFLSLGISSIFLGLFASLCFFTFQYRHFSIDPLHSSLEDHVKIFSQKLNASFIPLHHLFDQQGPLGIFSNLIQSRIQQNDTYAFVIAQVFSDQLSPHHLNHTDHQMMLEMNQKVDTILDFAQSQIIIYTTQAYLYLQLGQTVIRKIDIFLFYASLISTILIAVIVMIEINIHLKHPKKHHPEHFLLE